MRKFVTMLLAIALGAAPIAAQTMTDAVRKLYTFGSGCSDQICLGGIGGVADTTHKNHFNPAAAGTENAITVFLTNAIGASAANIPIAAATSTGILVQSGEGLPTRISTSGGPIFAERMQTLGKGSLYVSFNTTSFDYSTLRGVPLSGLQASITHRDVGAAGLGNPAFENDVIEVTTSMRVNMTAFTTALTYGLFDRVDVGVAVPFLYTNLSGTSKAQIMPFGPNDPHYFGDSASRSSQTTSSASASATGIGDVAARVKVSILSKKDWGLALLGDVRFPTGNTENFQGSGTHGFQAIAIASARFNQFSPHANVGYFFHQGNSLNDDVLATIGFDQAMASWATLAVDAISQWQVGTSTFQLPPNDTLTSINSGGIPNTTRTIVPSNIPDQRDNVVVGSFGVKFLLHSGITIVTNALVPVLRGALQPSVAWTLGLDYRF